MINNTQNIIWRTGNNLLIKLAYNDFDSSTSEDFQKVFLSALKRFPAKAIVLDFSEVVFIDGPGLAAIVNFWHIANEKNIKLILASLNDHIKELFTNKKIDTLIDIAINTRDGISIGNNFAELQDQFNHFNKNIETVFGAFEQNNEKLSDKHIVHIKNKITSLEKVS